MARSFRTRSRSKVFHKETESASDALCLALDLGMHLSDRFSCLPAHVSWFLTILNRPKWV